MAIVDTIWGMRKVYDEARSIIFEPTTTAAGPIMATNVQDAISQLSSSIISTVFPTPVQIVVGQSPYSVQTSDRILNVKTSGGVITIVMQSGVGRAYDLEVKDIDGQAKTNPITVQMQAGETADGLSPYLIDTNYSDVKFRPQVGGYSVES